MKVSTMSGYQSQWLRAEDLQDHTVRVRVGEVTTEILPSFEGQNEERLVVSFQGKSKRLPLNRSQAGALVRLFGDDTEAWIGKEVLLSPTPSRQPGKLTIAIAGVPVETADKDGLPF